MDLVIDANVLIAALLKEAVTRELMLDSRLRFFAPEHLLVETQKHLKSDASLRKRIRISSSDLDELFLLLTQNILTVTESEFAHRIAEATKLAAHKEDAPYIALGLTLSLPIWSNDKGVGVQKSVRVYSTAELVAILGRHRG